MSEALNRSIDLHTCRQHHVVLRFVIGDMPAAEPFDANEAAMLLRRLRSVLVRHLQLEDEQLYPALRQTAANGIATIARRYQVEMGGLRSAFEAFCERWNDAASIAADPRLFLLDWETIRDPLVKRMDSEDRGLYDVAEEHFAERLRDRSK